MNNSAPIGVSSFSSPVRLAPSPQHTRGTSAALSEAMFTTPAPSSRTVIHGAKRDAKNNDPAEGVQQWPSGANGRSVALHTSGVRRSDENEQRDGKQSANRSDSKAGLSLASEGRSPAMLQRLGTQLMTLLEDVQNARADNTHGPFSAHAHDDNKHSLPPNDEALEPAPRPTQHDWVQMVQRHGHHEGRSLWKYDAPIYRWAAASKDNLDALSRLIGKAEDGVNSGVYEKGFLEDLHKAYQRGVSKHEIRLQPERTVATLDFAVSQRISVKALEGSVTRALRADMLRSVASALMIYLPGFGASSVQAAHWARESIEFSPQEHNWSTLALATIIGLGEAGNAAGRAAGAGPIYTKAVNASAVPHGEQMVEQIVDDKTTSALIRALSFTWFLPGLALIATYERSGEPGDVKQRQAMMRFWVGFASTAAVALHNNLIPRVLGLSTVTALDGRDAAGANIDERREYMQSFVDHMERAPWSDTAKYLGSWIEGPYDALKNLYDSATSAERFGQALWSIMPESTSVTRFVFRTLAAEILLNAGAGIGESLEDGNSTAKYRGAMLQAAFIAVLWGLAMELVNQICKRMGASDVREQDSVGRARRANDPVRRDVAPRSLTAPPAEPPQHTVVSVADRREPTGLPAQRRNQDAKQ
jgi:hypothetical protein